MTGLADQFETFLIDIDGVLMIGDKSIPEVPETVQRLQDAGKQVRAVTNSSRSTRSSIEHRLKAEGIQIDREDIFPASWVAANYLKNNGYQTVYVIGSEGLRSLITNRDIEIVDQKASEVDIDAVVVGQDYSVTYEDLKKATQFIHYQDAHFIGVHRDGSYPSEDGIAPATGAIVQAIEAATGKTPTIIGKPKPTIFETALGNTPIDDAVMIGDNPIADIEGAQNVGLSSILITSDNYPKSSAKPDFTINNLSNLFD